MIRWKKRLLASAAAATVALASLSALAQEVGGTIVWWGWKPIQAEGDGLAAQFEQLNPNVDVQFTWQVYADYVPALKLNLAAGEAPDIWFTEFGALLNEHAPFLEDLGPWAEKAWGADWKSRFVTAPLEASIKDGLVQGIPWVNLGAGTLWYNKTQFDQLGLKPPTTLEEWKEVSAKLKEAGLVPFIQGASEDWVNFDHIMAIANQVAPGKIYEADAGTIPWTDPGLVKAMEIWKSLFDEGLMQEGALAAKQYPDAADAFITGKASMIMMGTWQNAYMTQATLDGFKQTYGFTENWEFVPFAYPDIDGDGNTGPMTVGPDAIAVMNKDSSSKEATWALIEFLLSDEVQQTFADRLVTPATNVPLNAAMAMTDAQRAGLELETRLMSESSYPRKLTGTETSTALGIALQRVASGQLSPADALAEVQRVADRVRR
jgi:raffinose/stachyose/melibiose transport system substrate-binding protein